MAESESCVLNVGPGGANGSTLAAGVLPNLYVLTGKDSLHFFRCDPSGLVEIQTAKVSQVRLMHPFLLHYKHHLLSLLRLYSYICLKRNVSTFKHRRPLLLRRRNFLESNLEVTARMK